MAIFILTLHVRKTGRGKQGEKCHKDHPEVPQRSRNSVGQFLTLHVRENGLGIGLGLALLLYFMNIIANIAEPASFLKYITPFGYTEAADIIADGSLSAVKLLIGLGIALAGILLAFQKYSEKDLN